MKRLRDFTVRVLLIVMACFVVHDYMTGQSDLVVKERSVHILTKHTNGAPIVLEHQTFHMLALNDISQQHTLFSPAAKLHFEYSSRLKEYQAAPPYTPPKTFRHQTV